VATAWKPAAYFLGKLAKVESCIRFGRDLDQGSVLGIEFERYVPKGPSGIKRAIDVVQEKDFPRNLDSQIVFLRSCGSGTLDGCRSSALSIRVLISGPYGVFRLIPIDFGVTEPNNPKAIGVTLPS
jgi:hypothetical protein